MQGLRGTGSASTLYGAGIGENLFLGQQYSGGVLGQLQGLNLDNLGAAGAGWGPAQRHLQDQTVLAQQCLQSLLNNPALVGSVRAHNEYSLWQDADENCSHLPMCDLIAAAWGPTYFPAAVCVSGE